MIADDFNVVFCRLLNISTAYLMKRATTPSDIILYLLSFELLGPSGRVPPIIRQGPANQTVPRGALVQLHCRVIGGPSIRISWEKDGERLQGNKPRVTLAENGTLQITDVKVRTGKRALFIGKGTEKVIFFKGLFFY